MTTTLNLLIIPHQRRRRVQTELEHMSSSQLGYLQLDLSRLKWGDRREGVLIDLGSCPAGETLPRILSGRLDCPVLEAYIGDDAWWGYYLCYKGSVMDSFRTVGGGPDETPQRHNARLSQHFTAGREDLLEFLVPWTEENAGVPANPFDVHPRGDCRQLEDFLKELAPWTWGLLAPGALEEGASLEPPAAPVSVSAATPASGGETAPEGSTGKFARTVQSDGTPGPEWDANDMGRCLPLLSAVRLKQAPKTGILAGILAFFARLLGRSAPAQVQEVDPKTLDTQGLEGLLEQFYSKKLEQLELEFAIPGETTYVKRLGKRVAGPPTRLSMELVQEKGRFVCVGFDDKELYLYWLIADKNAYFNVESDELPKTTLAGRTVDCYLVHSKPALIRRELAMVLSNLGWHGGVFDCLNRMGVWSNEYHYRNKQKHQQLREAWCLGASPQL